LLTRLQYVLNVAHDNAFPSHPTAYYKGDVLRLPTRLCARPNTKH